MPQAYNNCLSINSSHTLQSRAVSRGGVRGVITSYALSVKNCALVWKNWKKKNKIIIEKKRQSFFQKCLSNVPSPVPCPVPCLVLCPVPCALPFALPCTLPRALPCALSCALPCLVSCPVPGALCRGHCALCRVPCALCPAVCRVPCTVCPAVYPVPC